MTDPGPEVDGRHPADVVTVRRVADHLVDHLAEFEARVAGWPTEPDAWTLRQVAFHVAEPAFYADSVGAITP